MLDFFLSRPTSINYATIQYPKWDWIKRNYKDSIDNLISYYNYRTTIVNNKHLLTRIIKTAFPGFNKDLFAYVKDLEINARNIARHFKLVNSVSEGTIFTNIFYSKNSYEIINHVEFKYDFLQVDKDYLAYSPLRVIYTEETDLDFHLLNGTKPKNKPSLTVFELDITLMLIMYRAWCKRRIKFNFSTDPNVFVSSVVIPNTIRTMVDHVIFNRFIYISNGVYIPEFKLKHKIFVLDYSRGVDDILSRVSKNVLNENIALYKFITSIPTIYYDNMYDTLKLTNQLQTKQSLWSTWMARVKYINTLLDLIGPNGEKANTAVLYTLPYDIKEVRNGRTSYFSKLKMVKPIEEEYVEAINDIYNKL